MIRVPVIASILVATVAAGALPSPNPQVSPWIL